MWNLHFENKNAKNDNREIRKTAMIIKKHKEIFANKKENAAIFLVNNTQIRQNRKKVAEILCFLAMVSSNY